MAGGGAGGNGVRACGSGGGAEYDGARGLAEREPFEGARSAGGATWGRERRAAASRAAGRSQAGGGRAAARARGLEEAGAGSTAGSVARFVLRDHRRGSDVGAGGETL